MIDVEAIQATLNTGVIHVEIPSFVLHRGLGEMWLVGSAHMKFRINHHR
jgi:hypothetical protein